MAAQSHNFIILDLETGGLDEESNPITEVGLKVINAEFDELHKYKAYIKPYHFKNKQLVIEEEALRATNIKMSSLDKGKDIKAVILEIMDICKAHKSSKSNIFGRPIIVGHNISFDIKFLVRNFKEYNKNVYEFISDSYIDTQAHSKLLLPGLTSYKLGLICQKLNIKLVDAHGAMNDVNGTELLLKHIVSIFKVGLNGNKGNKINTTTEIEKERNHFQF